MTIVFAIISVACIAALIALMFYNKKLEGQVSAANQESERLRQHYESETQRVYREAQAAVADAQKQIDQQFAELKQESERLRQHYETETRKSQDAADALVAKTINDFEPLRKFEKYRDAEAEVQRQLDDALKEATSLRAEAQSLMEQAKVAATNERAQAIQRAKASRRQDLVNQQPFKRRRGVKVELLFQHVHFGLHNGTRGAVAHFFKKLFPNRSHN